LKNKRITLGLTGGIAIYKSASLLRRLISDYAADVTVIMTAAAQKFMSPLIFETFSGKPVVTEMFSRDQVYTRHIDLGQDADMVLVCPATANIVAKAASGIADDMLSTVILTAGAKTVFALAMNSKMYANPVTQANIQKLRELDYGFIEPESGELACRDMGKGRLAEELVILDYVRQRFSGVGYLSGKRVVVTAGPTREYLDPVRFISNRSSGKMGYALAAEVRQQGADVVLISGPGTVAIPSGVQFVRVETACEMQQALRDHGRAADYLFMAAAVEDITPVKKTQTKMKKTELPEAIAITRSPDLLLDFRNQNRSACVVAFSVEMEDGHRRSVAKMNAKGADFIVWNDPSVSGAAFEGDTNTVSLIAADGQEWQLPLASKVEIARQIIEHVVTHRRGD